MTTKSANTVAEASDEFPSDLVSMSGCLPAALATADERTHYRFVEFFTAQIRNKGTRAVYARAVRQFFTSRQLQSKSLEQINSLDVASYIEWLQGRKSVSTVKLHSGSDSVVIRLPWFPEV